MTAIIEINGIALSEFIRRFFDALGLEGLFIIFLGIFLIFLIDIIQLERRFKKTKDNSKKVDFYYKKLDEAKTKGDYTKLNKWLKQNRDAFYY